MNRSIKWALIRIWLATLIIAAAAGFGAGRASARTDRASWYGPGLYGHKLACPYYGTLSRGTWGVAHRTLPCGAVLKICLQVCAFARVVDRGPYVRGIALDLTRPVADYIGLLHSGVAFVFWKVVQR